MLRAGLIAILAAFDVQTPPRGKTHRCPTKKMRQAQKCKNLGRKFHRQVEYGKERFRIEERIHSRDQVAR